MQAEIYQQNKYGSINGQSSANMANEPSDNSISCSHFACMAGHPSTAKLQGIKFIIDSGATHHIINNCSMFESCADLDQHIQIRTAKKGAYIYATKQGNVRISISTGQKGVLEGVLYCPEAPENLLFVRKFQLASFETTYHSDGSITITGNKNTIIIGKLTNNLPNLKLNLNTEIATTFAHICSHICVILSQTMIYGISA